VNRTEDVQLQPRSQGAVLGATFETGRKKSVLINRIQAPFDSTHHHHRRLQTWILTAGKVTAKACTNYPLPPEREFTTETAVALKSFGVVQVTSLGYRRFVI
jgi:hypothetical protein